ncbi:hypothetical protein CGW93_04970 [candidate division bacterium WOR-3 4484_18]|uniref:Uncharacterized protein n=1 Tax=candidate division WOR-3 bacterium 4484_18 TaxID=2020626 RepID=A0A257LSX6_UNCW3|nr:MAG: hypothetical protein CGW93_04970 [candidate division bacterium WOR-3 4484_18]
MWGITAKFLKQFASVTCEVIKMKGVLFVVKRTVRLGSEIKRTDTFIIVTIQRGVTSVRWRYL